MKLQNMLRTKFINVLIMSLLFMLAVAACSPAGAGSEVEPGFDSEADLTGTQWILDTFGPKDSLTAVQPDTTITLQFEEDGINGSAGCNSYFGSATLSGSTLSFGPLGSTKMACPEPIMQQETDYLAALGTVNGYTLVDELLTLQYEEGVLIFTADVVTEEADVNEDSKTLFVGPELVDCVGVGPQECMQVREDAESDWTFFYDQIVGFEYEPGFEYELLVRETEIENPPADGSSIEVTLVEVVSKTAVSATAQPLPNENPLHGTGWTLTEFGPSDSLTAVLPNSELTLNFDDGQINGSAGCNSYFAEATVDGETISVGLIGSTLMACADEALNQQETDFLAALAEVTSYTLADNRLTLNYSDGILVFEVNEMVEADDEIVEWETAVSLLKTGDVVEIFQTHSLDVTLTLVDGRVVKTVEPAIDDIFSAISDCGEPCKGILMATE